MPVTTLKDLRSLAVGQTLFPETTLQNAINQLRFVQADPIKAPASAQDLILRQRVADYRVGDLDRQYESLGIEEDLLYAYGFVAQDVWRSLRPRKVGKLSSFQQRVLNAVQEAGALHPRDLEKMFGKKTVINAWGGNSKASTEALDELHSLGFLRIAKREKGIRIYSTANEISETITASERARNLILSVVSLLAPVSMRSLRETISRLRFLTDTIGEIKPVLESMLHSGELVKETVEGVEYVWADQTESSKIYEQENSRRLRFLAPFDPVVWDRRRFEHLWNWTYRFEAYTPVAKRVRGYYAMPMLWGDEVIGWANISLIEKSNLEVSLGFVESRPKEKQFKIELDNEIERMKRFLI